jgi:glycosyltransferase involved in cell wall biosynthesis
MQKKTKKRVLFVETGMGFGGSAISLKQIVENLRNYDPVVVFYAENGHYFSDHFRDINTRFLGLKFTYKQKHTLRQRVENITGNKLAISTLLTFFSFFSYLEDKITVYKLSRIIKRQKIDLMHINNGIDPIAVSAARQCGIPCIAHSRGHEYVPPKQTNIDYISKLIAPTKKIAHHNRTHINVPSEKIIVIHNSVDLEDYADNKERAGLRSHYGLTNNEILMGMFARVRPMKGQLVLAKAICQLKEQGYPVKCLFVGDASDYGDDYLDEIKRYISQRNQENAFIFAGYQSDTASHYAAVDIVVHPSISEEAFGRIIIEAWASARPIVASNIGASVELIDHEKTGLIIEKNNPDELAKALERLIVDDKLNKEIAQAGARHSLNFGNDSLITAVEAIYRKTLDHTQ